MEKLDTETKAALEKVAGAIRQIAMDATERANSGHPGLPMGCAELAAYLWGVEMHYLPSDPNWLNRDRFILSAGHGCLLLYSVLHMAGYPLTLEDLKAFRQLHSKTPGHPEKMVDEGIETTTGPLGQGFGNAVGEALGFKLLAERFNREEKIFSNKVFCLAGDGCIMEGVSAEVSSLAGHLGIDNLIVFYDANKICLDGPISECLSEDTKMRYLSYGWDVFELDGYDFDAMHALMQRLRKEQTKPVLVITHTIIGRGAPTKEGTHKAHGSPLGKEEVAAAKRALGLSSEPFYIPEEVNAFFSKRREFLKGKQESWQLLFKRWQAKDQKLAAELKEMQEKKLPEDFEKSLSALEIKNPLSGRVASQDVILFLAKQLPFLIGGSADLSGSDMTMMKDFPIVQPHLFSGRNIKFGVREFGMGTMAIGLEQTNCFIPFVGTFLTFSDYMRNSIRLAALQRSHVIYHFTHDSIFLGEDGPTHQAVEHYAALRAIPHLQFIRPSGNHEVKMAWIAALLYQGPTAFALSRQNIPTLPETVVPFKEGMGRGGYVVKKESGKAAFTLLATGSELPLAMDVAKALEAKGMGTRVVSMPCWQLFDKQTESYRKEVLEGCGKRVAIEAGVSLGWHRYIGSDGIAICMDDFGLSAPAPVLAEAFGFTVEHVLSRLLKE